MQLAIMAEVEMDLNWPRWAELTSAIERLGFSGVFLSDHFGDGKQDALETITALTYLASHSHTLHFGTLVAPLSIRDPVMLARQAVAINDLSGGRMVLGIGAGWQEDEHTMFGYNLGDVSTRMKRFDEGVQVISELIRSDTPVAFEGRYYRIHEGLLPRPQQPLPILIGGNGPKRTLPTVAKYANIWNCQVASPEVFKERSALLDTLLLQAGRKVTDVKRTVFVPVYCWRNANEMEEIAAVFKQWPAAGGKSTEEVFDLLRLYMAAITGTPDRVVEQLRAYESVGVEELMMSIMGVHRIDYVESLATLILPHFAV